MQLATRSGAEVSDTLKYLSERIPATFVYAGIDLERQGLFSGIRGSQIAGRFTLIPTLPFPLAGEWRGLAATLEDALRLRRHQAGTLAGLDRYLHQRTGGMIGSLSHLIRGAAIEAIQSGTEQITRKLLDTIDIDHAAQQESGPGKLPPAAAGPTVTAEAAQPPLRPLPIRPGPVSGDTTFSYIRRLAVANHMRPLHLRRYLTGPGGGFRLSWLAILAGRPVASLQHALVDQEPPEGIVSRSRPPDARQGKRSKAELFTLIRRDARERGLSARALADKYGTGKRIVRQALQSPRPAPRKPQPPRGSRLDPFTSVIDDMLQAEPEVFPPRRQPVISIYRELITRPGTDGISYQMVRQYVGRRRAVIQHQSLSPAHQAVIDHDLNRLRGLLNDGHDIEGRQRRRLDPAPPRHPCRGRSSCRNRRAPARRHDRVPARPRRRATRKRRQHRSRSRTTRTLAGSRDHLRLDRTGRIN